MPRRASWTDKRCARVLCAGRREGADRLLSFATLFVAGSLRERRSGGDDSVNVLIRVRRVTGDPVCSAPYTLLYGDE